MTQNIYDLPNSENLSILILSKVFNETTNSYKYLFLISLLDILARRNFVISSPINFRELIIEILANAWYSHNYFKLSFGTQDKIANKLDSLDLDFNQFKDTDKVALRKVIENQSLDDITADIMRYVPFRMIRPFFSNELRGIKDYFVNPSITDLSIRYFDSRKPIYCFDNSNYQNCSQIILHPEWGEYLKNNYSIVRGWVSWEWLNYMQRRNPSVPAIANKLFPPLTRDSLANQTKYWKIVLKHAEVKCIYSDSILSLDDLSLDHFLPWSFVAHDRLWNLIPTSKSVNSAKSNNIPSTQIYFNQFVNLQHLGLIVSYQRMDQKDWNKSIEPYLKDWNKSIEPYLMDLKISDKANLFDLENLRKAYQTTIIPLISLAEIQGFTIDWYYVNK